MIRTALARVELAEPGQVSAGAEDRPSPVTTTARAPSHGRRGHALPARGGLLYARGIGAVPVTGPPGQVLGVIEADADIAPV
jgi:hypothetical protein